MQGKAKKLSNDSTERLAALFMELSRPLQKTVETIARTTLELGDVVKESIQEATQGLKEAARQNTIDLDVGMREEMKAIGKELMKKTTRNE